MSDAARSRRLGVQARRAVAASAQSEEEGRAYLQTRLTLFTKLMFTLTITIDLEQRSSEA